MFDTLKILWLGASGALKHHKEARKLVWLLLVAFVFGWMTTAFAAWISFPSYRSLVDYLPAASTIAALFTGGVAGYIYFSIMYVSGFSVERWLHVPEPERNYKPLGARIIGLSCVFFLVIDFLMNLSGVGYRAEAAAGSMATYKYETPAETLTALKQAQKQLDDILSWNAGKMTVSGQRQAAAAQNAIISRLQQADSTSRAQFIQDKESANAARQTLKTKAERNLRGGVYGVYVLLLLISLVMAYITETIQRETNKARPKPAATGYQQNGTIQNHHQHTPTMPHNQYTELDSGSIDPDAFSGPVAGFQIVCKYCGTATKKKSAQAKYCCATCRVAASQERIGKELKRIPKEIKPIGYK
jgi:hypothetical protein